MLHTGRPPNEPHDNQGMRYLNACLGALGFCHLGGNPMNRLALLLTIISSPALCNEPICGPREQIIAMLEDQYAESYRWWGIVDDIRIAELYASEETGSFTIIATSPDVTSCIFASGDMWSPIDSAPGEDM